MEQKSDYIWSRSQGTYEAEVRAHMKQKSGHIWSRSETDFRYEQGNILCFFALASRQRTVIKGEILCQINTGSTKRRARPGFEPGTSRTRSENHTPRPTSQCYRKHIQTIFFNHQQYIDHLYNECRNCFTVIIDHSKTVP